MKTLSKEEFEKQNVFGLGDENVAYAKYFVGNSYLNPLTKADNNVHLSNVTFEPGCRNNWHIHRAKSGGGQLLICTAGEGWQKRFTATNNLHRLLTPAQQNVQVFFMLKEQK